jgi:hypothetical protein
LHFRSSSERCASSRHLAEGHPQVLIIAPVRAAEGSAYQPHAYRPVPVEVLAEVHTAIAVLEIQGPAITEALRQLDRATTMAWKAMNMLGVTDDEWELVKREIGIERGWEAAYQLVSTLDLPTMQPSADVTADGS